jgi:hypothetical protein
MVFTATRSEISINERFNPTRYSSVGPAEIVMISIKDEMLDWLVGYTEQIHNCS